MNRAEGLAEAHWKWLMELLEVLYKGAFIHGYKHGVEDKEGEEEPQ